MISHKATSTHDHQIVYYIFLLSLLKVPVLPLHWHHLCLSLDTGSGNGTAVVNGVDVLKMKAMPEFENSQSKKPKTKETYLHFKMSANIHFLNVGVLAGPVRVVSSLNF